MNLGDRLRCYGTVDTDERCKVVIDAQRKKSHTVARTAFSPQRDSHDFLRPRIFYGHRQACPAPMYRHRSSTLRFTQITTSSDIPWCEPKQIKKKR